jgi:hypothetical protein
MTMFGLLMQDNTPVDPRYRGVGYVPGGPYYPQRMGYVPGGPYYPGARLGFVPGGPYYRRFRGYGIPPGQAARVPQYGKMVNIPGVPDTFGDHTPGVPGVPESFGEDIPTSGMYSQPLGPVQQDTGWTSRDTAQVIQGVLDTTSGVIRAVSSGGQTYYQGSCPAGSVYVPSAGRCVATSGGGGDMTGLLVAGAVGLGLVALMMSRKG